MMAPQKQVEQIICHFLHAAIGDVLFQKGRHFRIGAQLHQGTALLLVLNDLTGKVASVGAQLVLHVPGIPEGGAQGDAGNLSVGQDLYPVQLTDELSAPLSAGKGVKFVNDDVGKR